MHDVLRKKADLQGICGHILGTIDNSDNYVTLYDLINLPILETGIFT